MIATIIFDDGTKLTAEVNGSCYIMDEKPDFPEEINSVTITEDKETQTFENPFIIECASVDGRYWFSFGAESAYEKTIRELREENELLEGAIAELAEIIGGGE